MSIVVTASTGDVGSRVTCLLVQAGVRPRVLRRDPERPPRSSGRTSTPSRSA